MTNLRKLLAYNMRENRRVLGLTQAKLAEKTGLSTQYIAMIELSRKFPSPEKLEKLAQALEVDTPELFSISKSAEEAAQKLCRAILVDIEKTVGKTVNTVVKAAVSEIVEVHIRNMGKKIKNKQNKVKPTSSIR